MKTTRFLFLTLSCAALLSACGGDNKGGKNAISRAEAPMDQRVSIMALEQKLEPASAEFLGEGVRIPSPWNNGFWPQTGGYPSHAMGHVAFSTQPPKLLWRAKIGSGSDKRIPLNARPIVVDGKVFTLDTENRLSAFNLSNGGKLWSTNIGIEEEDDSVINGGIAFADGVVYATNGYNDVRAISAEDGSLRWHASLDAPSRAAPTIQGGRVFATTVDNRLIALNAEDGSFLWDHIGLSEEAALIGNASAAANNNVVIPAFSSGEILALRLENGAVAWADNLAGLKRGGGITAVSGIKAPAVIAEDQVFAVSFQGSLAAIDIRTGNRIWQRNFSGSEMPWISGNTLFVMSADGILSALDRSRGLIRWTTEFENSKKGKIITWMGPVLAGERLITVSSDGRIVEVNPANGAILNEIKTKDDIAFAPIIADQKMLLITHDGVLKVYQ